MVKIDFEFETAYGKFRDALYVEEGMYSAEELDTMKHERLNNWLYVIENPPSSSEE